MMRAVELPDRETGKSQVVNPVAVGDGRQVR